MNASWRSDPIGRLTPPDRVRRLRLPDFLLIGAAKAGTTSLFRHLARHPQICVPPRKEPAFFSRDDRYAWGLAWYASLFEPTSDQQLCGEGSTEYTRWPEVPEPPGRIRAALPHVKLIYIMRHPVDRAYSHYVHRYSKELFKGRPFTRTFEQHVAADPMCLNSSLYMKQIERYREHYPREALLPLLTEDLDERPEAVLRQVCGFLGVAYRADMLDLPPANVGTRYAETRARHDLVRPIKAIPGVEPLGRLIPTRWRDGMVRVLRRSPWGRRVRQRYTPPPMTEAVRRKYLAHFAETVDAVEAFIGRDLSAWRR